MPGETGAVAAGGSSTGASDAVDTSVNEEANVEGGEGDSGNDAGEADPKPKVAKKAAKVEDDPDFEWEEPGEDEKAPPVKRKIKMSEAKKTLANLRKERAAINAERALVQRHYEEQITPLERDIQELKNDPKKLLELSRRLGVDPRAALEELAKEELKLMNMTPEQRRVYQLEQEIARRDGEAKAQAERAKFERAQQESQRVQKGIADGMLKAAAEAKLPKHPMALSLMSAFLRAQVNNGQHPNPGEAAEAVREFALDYTKSSIRGLTYDQLVDTFPDVVRKIREGDSGRTADQPVTRMPRTPPKPKVTRAMSPAEFTAKMMRGE